MPYTHPDSRSVGAGVIPDILDLNVGGVAYTTYLNTLTNVPGSLFHDLFKDRKRNIPQDSKGRYFIDRDGALFRYVLDFLRNSTLVLPEHFHDKDRLLKEAEYFRLPKMVEIISRYQHSSIDDNAVSLALADIHLGAQIYQDAYTTGKVPGHITIGYRGSFAFGKDGLVDVKFRKLARILVCGRVSLCREVFKDTLNEGRDPDRGHEDRYTARFFLTHSNLEQSFAMLAEEGFNLMAACGTDTNNNADKKPGMDSEEQKWQHYNEFVFARK